MESEFPSPLGVSYFQILQKRNTDSKRILLGFRPLSGYLISKCVIISVSKSFTSSVSVPSRGILFPNASNEYVANDETAFPSPLGVSYFQMMKRMITIMD